MNKIKCSICGLENFILEFKCSKCGNIIREKVSNINLGEVLKNLLFNVDFEIKQILFAEHKNYLFFLMILFSFKLTLYTLFNISFIDIGIQHQNIIFILGLFTYWFLYLSIMGILLKIILNFILKEKLKLITTLALNIFPFVYFSLSLFIFFPLELMLFGKYLFSNNPSIFDINFSKAIIITILEIITLFYSFYLLFNFLVFILCKKFLSIFLMSLNILLLFTGNKVFKIIVGVN